MDNRQEQFNKKFREVCNIVVFLGLCLLSSLTVYAIYETVKLVFVR